MSITVRPIDTNDYPELLSMIKEFASFEKLPHKMTNSIDQMKAESEWINGFVATNNEAKIVGYTSYFYAYYTWSGKALYMDDLYVLAAYRKMGIGKKLINQIIKQAKDENCYKVRWQVSNWNKKAQEFYLSLGAEIDDVELNCDLNLSRQ